MKKVANTITRWANDLWDCPETRITIVDLTILFGTILFAELYHAFMQIGLAFCRSIFNEVVFNIINSACIFPEIVTAISIFVGAIYLLVCAKRIYWD